MNKTLIIILLCIPGYVFSQITPVPLAEDPDENREKNWSAGVTLSTLGPGVMVCYQPFSHIVLSGSTSFVSYTYPLNKLLTELQGNARLQTGGLGIFTDWYIWKNIFLTAGASVNFTDIRISGKMAESIMIGDIEMTPDDIGNVKIGIKPSHLINPYVGVGIGQKTSANKRLRVSFDLGVYFQGSPDVELYADGMLTPTADSVQEETVENNIRPVDFWPKIALNLTYNLW